MATDKQANSLMAEIVNNDEEIARLRSIAFDENYEKPEIKTLRGMLEKELKKQTNHIRMLYERINAFDDDRDAQMAAFFAENGVS